MEFQKFVTDFLSKMQDENPASAFTDEGQTLIDLSRRQELDTREAELTEEQTEVTDVDELAEQSLSSLTPRSEPAMDSASFETSIPEPESVPEPEVPSLFLSQNQQLTVDVVSATTVPGPEAVPNKQPEVPEALRPFFNDMIAQAESQFPEGIDNLEIREPGIELPPLPSIPEDIFVDNARVHMVSGEIMQRDRR